MNESSGLVLAKLTELTNENHTETRQCLNCGELLFGIYCMKCGQKDVSYSKSLGSVLSVFFESWFSLDNRTLRSVFPLFFRPGYLSTQFVAGKRMSFASPFKLYLFSSICYFFLFNTSLSIDDKAYDNSLFNKQTEKAEDQENTYDANLHSRNGDTIYLRNTSMTSNVTKSNKFADRISVNLKNPDKLRRSLLKGFSYMVFALMPLFALLLKWIMGEKKKYYFDHLVLTVHFHAFALLFFSLLLLAKITLGLTVAFYLFPVVVIYLFVSVKQFHNESWAKSIAKSITILSVYGLIFTIALVSTTLIIIAL
jgi:hypothetical protein